VIQSTWRWLSISVECWADPSGEQTEQRPANSHHLNLTKKQCQHCAVGAGRSFPSGYGAQLGRESPTAPTKRGTGLRWDRGTSWCGGLSSLCSNTQLLPPGRGRSSPRRLHQAHFRELPV
uniref:Uncharacterized protein n=1 Tax=Buteo japonicus TaxID=224669 RepID=A0A8B9Z9R9_9AVES